MDNLANVVDRLLIVSVLVKSQACQTSWQSMGEETPPNNFDLRLVT